MYKDGALPYQEARAFPLHDTDKQCKLIKNAVQFTSLSFPITVHFKGILPSYSLFQSPVSSCKINPLYPKCFKVLGETPVNVSTSF